MNRTLKLMLILIGLSAFACATPKPTEQSPEQQPSAEEGKWSNESRAVSTARLRTGVATQAAIDATPQPVDSLDGGFPLTLSLFNLDNTGDGPLVTYEIANKSTRRVDYFEFKITALDREGAPVGDFLGEATKVFADESDLEGGAFRQDAFSFRDWEAPIKTARFTFTGLVFDGGEKAPCLDETQKCSWTVTLD